MIYSVVPYEKIFEQDINKYVEELKEDIEEVNYNGIIVQGVRQKDNTFLINRIISSDPKYYLKGKLTPGSIINLYTKN